MTKETTEIKETEDSGDDFQSLTRIMQAGLEPQSKVMHRFLFWHLF